MSGPPIVIDCDPGVDDAVAILLALASPDDLELLGISAVAGNVGLERTSANARRVLELAGRADVPVHAGCACPMLRPLVHAEQVHGETGLDGAGLPPPRTALADRHAVDFLIETCAARPGEVTVCALGPLTNLALAIIKDASFVGNVGEIVLMGGAVGAGNITPAAEFNVYVDPHAAAVVFASGVRLTMIGLDVTRQAIVTRPRLDAIRAIDTSVGRAVTGLLEHYHRDNPDRYGAPLHDPCVIARVLRPELFGGRPAFVEVETSSEAAIGRTLVDFWNSASRAPNAMVLKRIDSDGFFELVIERLTLL